MSHAHMGHPAPETAYEPVEIAAGALQLQPFAEFDAPDLMAAMDDPEIQRWNGSITRGEHTLEGARAWIAQATDLEIGTAFAWGVRDATTGELLGQMSLFKIDHDQGDAELGYWILPTARRRGVGRSAALAVMGYAFGGLGLRRVQLFHAVDNVASCRLATAAGLVLEGTHRESHRYGDGVWHDEHTHARLARDASPM